MMRVRSAALVFALAGAACGGGQTPLNLFSTDWTDDSGHSIEAVRIKLGGARANAGADVVVAVAGNADKIIGQGLGASGAKWTFAHPLDARPIIAGSVVVGSGGGELFALDALGGRKLWARPTGGLKIHGAGDDGSVTVITMTRGSGSGSTLLAVLHDGSVVRQIETDKALGTPAVLGGEAFVPWGNVYVSALDLANGDEAGRVVMREQVSRAWVSGGNMYFGEIGIFRFDHHIKDASSNRATHASIPPRELPGSPKLMPPGTENPGPAATAPDRIRIYARPTSGDAPLAIESNRYYATYFRLAMAFDATKGSLAWVHTHGSDVVGGAAGSGFVALCDEQGRVTMLDAKSGGQVGEQDLGEPVKSCVVQADAYKPTAAPRGATSLAQQIADALLNRESQLATAQRLLLRELATLDDELATKTLVELASDPRTSPALLGDARTALANRRNGARYMIEALERHYDFLKDVLRAPPVAPMAQALAAMHEKQAAPLLASHLLDPADTDDDVRRAAEALITLGGPNEAPKLKQFFGMYRASAPNEEIGQSVVSAGQALAKLGGADGRAIVREALSDPMTREDVRERLQALVQGLDDDEKKAAPDASKDAGAPPPKKAPPKK
jgi:outer membrane protein assembly factor BamB